MRPLRILPAATALLAAAAFAAPAAQAQDDPPPVRDCHDNHVCLYTDDGFVGAEDQIVLDGWSELDLHDDAYDWDTPEAASSWINNSDTAVCAYMAFWDGTTDGLWRMPPHSESASVGWWFNDSVDRLATC